MSSLQRLRLWSLWCSGDPSCISTVCEYRYVSGFCWITIAGLERVEVNCRNPKSMHTYSCMCSMWPTIYFDIYSYLPSFLVFARATLTVTYCVRARSYLLEYTVVIFRSAIKRRNELRMRRRLRKLLSSLLSKNVLVDYYYAYSSIILSHTLLATTL
jgi:hypothetical protein